MSCINILEDVMNNLLNEVERNCLLSAERHDTGGFDNWRKEPRNRQFIVNIDARPLVSLVDSAANGNRVYEFMSIQRPGDVLHYLWVTFVELDDEVIHGLKENLAYQYPFEFDKDAEFNGLSFIDFDTHFSWQGDDTSNESHSWRMYIEKEFWCLKLENLYEMVCLLQAGLKYADNFLLQNELKLIEFKKHRRDYFHSVSRSKRFTLPAFIEAENIPFSLKKLVQIISQHDVNSVSCPFGVFAIWRILVEEQVKRSISSGLPAQETFALYGPDRNLGDDCCPEDWGGYVHIPYEGMCDADVIFLPNWRVFHIEHSGLSGSLAKTLSMEFCRYLFVPKARDFGELECASREELGNWVLYRCQFKSQYD